MLHRVGHLPALGLRCILPGNRNHLVLVRRLQELSEMRKPHRHRLRNSRGSLNSTVSCLVPLGEEYSNAARKAVVKAAAEAVAMATSRELLFSPASTMAGWRAAAHPALRVLLIGLSVELAWLRMPHFPVAMPQQPVSWSSCSTYVGCRQRAGLLVLVVTDSARR